VTPHKGQRKSPSKKDVVVQRSVEQAAEATRMNTILENQNQELRRDNEELLQIIQQALEEHESLKPRISKALYRRIKRQAPNIVEELPDSIKPLSDTTLGTRDLLSVSSLDQVSGSSSSGYSSRERESPAAEGSNGRPSKRQRSTRFPAVGVTGVTTFTTHCPTSAQDMSTVESVHEHQNLRMPSTTPHTHPSPPLRADMPTHFHQDHLPEPQIASSFGNYEPPSSAFEQQHQPAQYSIFDVSDDAINDRNPSSMGLLDPFDATDWNMLESADSYVSNNV
jgi:hypothetical protein